MEAAPVVPVLTEEEKAAKLATKREFEQALLKYKIATALSERASGQARKAKADHEYTVELAKTGRTCCYGQQGRTSISGRLDYSATKTAGCLPTLARLQNGFTQPYSVLQVQAL